MPGPVFPTAEDKRQAQLRARSAVASGKITRHPCEVCGALLEACKLAEARPPVDDTDIAIRDTLRAAIALAGKEGE